MPKRRKTWVYSPPKPKKPKVPELVKAELSQKAQQLIEEHLRPEHVKPPPKTPQFNYIIDLATKWYQSYFYFCSTYACPHPDAISPTFESRFARLGYQGQDRFNLAYMRHNGKWNEILFDLSLDECLTAMKEDPHFFP
ncbi:hypothetical protein ACFL2Q_00615 [Thermodesulfobacteriota bacterium]